MLSPKRKYLNEVKIFIDGYNLINKWPRLMKAKRESIESARAELFNIIQAYCDYTAQEGIIVYDGKGKERSFEDTNPRVIFSRKGETADTVIEAMVYNIDDKTKVRVVTEDRALENMITGMSASLLSAENLESEIRSVSSSIKDFIDENRDKIAKRGIEL